MNCAPSITAAPDVAGLLRQARSRDLRFLLGGMLLALLVGAAVLVAGPKGVFAGAAVLLLPAALLLFWYQPRATVWFVLAAACLFELQPVKFSDGLTDRVPLFWNINTIFQRYAHVDFKAVPIDPLELILILAGTASLLRGLLTHRLRIRPGELVLPIAAYSFCVLFAFANGVASGGESRLALMEVRPHVFFLAAYFLAANLVREEREFTPLFWIVALTVGLKGILYTFRRYVTLAGLPLPDQGVGSHEEVFYFNCFVMLLGALFLTGSHVRLQRVMLCLLPFVVLGNLACNRRAGTAALVIGALVLIPAALRAFKSRRLLVGIVSALILVISPIYFLAFRHSESPIAAPARAIQSHFAPTKRDMLSNRYRDAEDADLMATVRVNPVLGYGYGRRMLHAVPIDDISQIYEFWDLLPHNQVLWVWMRVGTVGFIMFWLMVSAIVVRACLVMRADQASPTLRTVGLFSLLCVSMLLVFALLDMQLAHKRNMLMLGVWTGVLVSIPCSRLLAEKRAPEVA